MQGGKLWEVSKWGIGCHEEHAERPGDGQDVAKVAQTFLSVDGARYLADNGLVMRRNRLNRICQNGDTHKQRDQDQTHGDKRVGRIFRSGLAE